MMLQRLLLFTVVAGLCATSAQAQEPHRYYLVGEAGGSFGDGGSTPATALGFGFLPSRNFGVELEVSYIPGLDSMDRTGFGNGFRLPFDIEASRRVVGLQTHVVGILPAGDTKLRAFVTGGGGVTNVEHRVRVSPGDLLGGLPHGLPAGFPQGFSGFPGFPGLSDFSAFSIGLPSEIEQTRSDASLVLSAGGGIEYAVSRNVGLGLVARYQRVFTNPNALDMARVGLRARLNF